MLDWGAYTAAGLLGLLVGGSELVARYRDAPAKAVRCPPALFYIGVNVLASVTALAVTRTFDWRFGLASDSSETQLVVIQVLVAGLGAMALFRSSLFTVRVGDNDVAVGPSSVLQIVLDAADREVARTRAQPRGDGVKKIMQGVSFDEAKKALPTFCFNLVQNVTAEEIESTKRNIDALAAATDIKPQVKALILGLILMNIVGEAALETAVTTLKESIATEP